MDPHLPPTGTWNPAPDDPRDELLARHLEQHLEHLDGTPAVHADTPDPEWDRLRPVVERLHRLADALSTSPTMDRQTPTTVFPAAGAADAEGRHLGKYEILRPLGEGGQAMTLLARDPDLGRQVVLKLYHHARSAEDQERVLTEGKALARVRSPYVAQCYSAEREGGMAYLVMEYIPGPTLAQQIRQGGLDVGQSLELVRHLAEGLAAVHACGLLHRDIKPGNIILGDDGRPRLVDFGLAVAVGGAALGEISGTPAYMAPEQARGEEERIDPRTDLFALGAVLYELLTGQRLYQGTTTGAVLEAARACEIVPPGVRNPRLPRRVQELCQRCLAKDPTRRFASAAELAAAIRRIQGGRRWLWLAVGGAAALMAAVAVGLGLSGLWRPTPATPDTGPITVVIPPPPTAEEDRHPSGRPLRRDFLLKVTPEGGVFDPPSRAFVLKPGQVLKFRIEAAIKCNVALWDVTDQRIVQLFPNEDETENGLKAGQPRVLPEEKNIRAKKPSGLEYVHVMAATKPLRLREGQNRSGFEVFEQKDRMRLLNGLRDMELAEPGDEVSEVILRFRVEE